MEEVILTDRLLEDIKKASSTLNWGYYNYWPGWVNLHQKEFGAELSHDSFLLKIKSQHSIWCLPTSSDVKGVCKSISKLYDDLQPNDNLLLPLHVALWCNFSYTTPVYCDYGCETQTIISMAGEELKSRKQGIRRYTRNVGEYEVRDYLWTSSDKEQAANLLNIWSAQKFGKADAAGSEVYRHILFEEEYQRFGTKAVAVLHNNVMIALGVGARLSDTWWAMLVRISDRTFAYSSEFVYQKTAEKFSDVKYQSDGQAIVENDSVEENANLRWYKQKHSNISLTKFFVDVIR